MELGPELILNGDFALEAQDWTIGGSGWDLGEANATYYDNSGTWGNVTQYLNGAVEANKKYQLSFDVDSYTGPLQAAGVKVIGVGMDSDFYLAITGTGHYEADFETTQVPASITIQARSTTSEYGEVIVDNVSIREVIEAPAATDDSLLTEVEKRAIAHLLALTDAAGDPLFKNVEVVDGTPRCRPDREASVDHWTGQISFGKSGMESFERFAPFAFVCCRLARVTREGGYDANIRITLDIVIGQHDDKGYARIGRDGLVGLNRIFELVFMAFDGWHPGTWRPGEPIGCDDFFLVDTMESVEDKTKYGRQLHFEANWIPVTE